MTVPFELSTLGTQVSTPPFCIAPFNPKLTVPCPKAGNKASSNENACCIKPEVLSCVSTA